MKNCEPRSDTSWHAQGQRWERKSSFRVLWHNAKITRCMLKDNLLRRGPVPASSARISIQGDWTYRGQDNLGTFQPHLKNANLQSLGTRNSKVPHSKLSCCFPSQKSYSKAPRWGQNFQAEPRKERVCRQTSQRCQSRCKLAARFTKCSSCILLYFAFGSFFFESHGVHPSNPWLIRSWWRPFLWINNLWGRLREATDTASQDLRDWAGDHGRLIGVFHSSVERKDNG